MSRIRALFVVATLGTVACGPFRSTEQAPPENDSVTTTQSSDPAPSPGAQNKPQDPGPTPESTQPETTNPNTTPPEKSLSVLPESEDDCAPLIAVACRSCCASLAGLKAAKGEEFSKNMEACIEDVCE